MGTLIQLFRSRKNTKHQFDQLLAPHIETMYRMAYHWTRSQEDAEDLVQDVLIRLADKVDDMLGVENLRPWLVKVVYRRFVDLHRRERASPFVDINDEAATAPDDTIRIDRFVHTVSESEYFISKISYRKQCIPLTSTNAK